MSTWTFGLDLGMLYPAGRVVDQLRALAWQLGLQFDGHSRRGLLGSTVQVRVSGEQEAVNCYAQTVVEHWS